MDQSRVGVIGCGFISGIYLKNMPRFAALDVVACADIAPGRAEQVAAANPGIEAMSVEALLADPSVDIIVNLTPPFAHHEIAKASLSAGKHVHGEKPLTVSFDEATELLALAKKMGKRIGCAPDTFLGAGIQTCRQLIDAGAIGEPVAATAFMTNHGHESWHPAPAFYYQRGGGPMLDMGPYYLTALVNLMGPVAAVSGSTRVTFPERTIGSEPLRGTKIKVETPTHVTGAVNFASGAVATVITSFDVWSADLPRVEIYGTEGSLSVPDPNTFGGPVRVWRSGKGEWEEVAVTRPFAENSRGVGVADMAVAIANKAPHRASGDLAAHVLETMLAFERSSDSGRRIELTTTCEKPEPLPVDLLKID
jgi:predicted dehydrogenase